MIDWWSGTAGVLIGTILGSAIPLTRSWWRRRIERRGEIEAMEVEMFLAARMLHALTTEGIMAPLYRLPVAMFIRALPRLIGEGLLSLNETGALVEYLNRVEELNRGLDRAGAGHASGQTWLLGEEATRNVAKATEFRKAEERLNGESLFDAAELTLFRLEEEFTPRARYWGVVPIVLRIPSE